MEGRREVHGNSCIAKGNERGREGEGRKGEKGYREIMS